jgi:NADP-dependent 3-hydroxy acid dehydrogenase YdfG
MTGIRAGSVAFVTGSASGIGRALAIALADRGVKVAVADIDLPGATGCTQEVEAAGGTAIPLQLDVTSRDDWREALTRAESALGPIDILCSNAGSMGCQSPVTDMPLDYMRWLFEVNVFGAMHAIQAIVPGMRERGHGHVLITASTASFAATPTFADYTASKHAVLAVADTLREEMTGTGVGVSILCPSGVSTNIAANTRRNAGPQLIRGPEKGMDSAASAAAVAASGGFLTAEAVASIALSGIEAGRFIIPTHRQSGAKAKERFEELQAALALLPA